LKKGGRKRHSQSHFYYLSTEKEESSTEEIAKTFNTKTEYAPQLKELL